MTPCMQRNESGINSYNGILLCKRPTRLQNKHISNQMSKGSSIALGHNSNSNNEQGSFLCGTVPTPWGSTSMKIKSEKNKVLSRLSRNDGALSRHKQWLKDMKAKKKQQIREKEEKERLKKEKEREFMERQARRRKKIRELETSQCDECNDESMIQDSFEEVDAQSISDPKRSGEKRCRPVWALTESEAKNVDQCMKNEEEEELMNFVDGLDFQQYFDDMELKVLMTQVKDRINQLERQRKKDQCFLNTILQSESSEAHNEKFNNRSSLYQYSTENRSNAFDDISKDDDISSVAASIRSCAEASISTIHSQKSLKMLVSKSRDKLYDTKGNIDLHTINEIDLHQGEVNLKPPIKITHTEDNGARLAETKSLNKLPFKNRNPAL